MRKASILAAALVTFGVGTLGMERDAHALGPVDLEIMLKGGYASSPTGAHNNPLGAGIGARAGIDIFSVYAGVQFMRYFGTDDASIPVPGGSASYKASAWLYGLDIGYNINVSILTLRPQIGLGNTTIGTSLQGTGALNGSASPGGSDNNFYLEPGAVALITIGWFSFGADANLLWVPAVEKSKAAFALDGQLGVKF
jgi:hypothetical protein